MIYKDLAQPEQWSNVVIGEGCRSGPGLVLTVFKRIELGRHVEVGPYVSLSDSNHSCMPVNGPVLRKSPIQPEGDGALRIGDRTRIGAHAVIAGNITIGQWSVIAAGSIVHSDVPDACIVAGNPARITAVYDPASSMWIRVHSQEEVEQVLSRRKEQPLLSICIPTYNRMGHLEACLNSIFSQIGPTDLVEVIVSDNASTDGTEKVATRFLEQYPNMRYIRNPENIGADRNIIQAAGMARGIFLKLNGDDDYFLEEAVPLLLSTLHNHSDCSLVHTIPWRRDGGISRGNGAEAYLGTVSNHAVAMTLTTFRRADWEKITDRTAWGSTSLSQVYWQYQILSHNPKFCTLGRNLYHYAGKAPDGYNFGKVAIRHYMQALSYFEGAGLSKEAITTEMTKVLYGTLIPWYTRIVQEKLGTDVSGFEDYYTECYRDQPYYEEVLLKIRAITALSRH
ncbi:glycosyltransferase [Paenibacillus albidus]|uniref:glycosyltransferase n=1 Tax=Paenibacillus albidus TaxID=2041023 RepID=UPI001BE92611|nr:glycosyltransferase [Paenibacillus albidus]MBT2287730.1 glycosyltransferase [Paenibacillus albidus]